jgi:hypothetical protein
MSEPLALNLRKVLASRCVMWRALARQKLDVYNANGETTWKALEQNLLEITAKGFLSPSVIPLDHFLRDTILPECTNLSYWYGPHQTVLMPSLEEIQGEIGRIACPKCSQIPGHICCDGEFDTDIAAGGGQCGSILENMFKSVVENAQAVYKTYASNFPSDVIPMIELELKNQNGKPHQFPNNPYWISAVTRYDDNESNFVSKIIVHLSIEHFNIETYLSCLYVFMHECICHAFQGLAATGLRTTTEPDDRFAEGWMDFLTLMLLNGSTQHGISGAKSFFVADFEQARVGESYHKSRLDYEHPDRAKQSIRWMHGKQTAQKLLHQLAHLPETAHSPEEAFLRLSFNLNLHPYGSNEREILLAQINKYLPLPGSNPPKRHKDFFPIIRKYIKDNDLTDFCQAIMNFG